MIPRIEYLIDSGQYALVTPYSQRVIATCREMPGLAWDRDARAWVGYADAMALVAARLDLPMPSVPPAALMSVYAPHLRPYQVQAADYLLSRQGAILADEMGLGKTATAICAARHVGGKLLIVCPNHVKGVWHNDSTGGELRKWGETRDVFVATTRKPRQIDAQICVINYDILDAWAAHLATWAPDVIIYDEAHALSNEKTKRSKAARAIPARNHTWALTGTPLTNRPKDLWNLVDTICPGRFGNFFAYAKRYCNARKENVTTTKAVWVFDGKSNLEELGARLAHFMIRRLKSDVALELPPKTRQIVYCDASTGGPVRSNMSRVELRQWLDRSADAKLPQAKAMLSAYLEEGRKVVVFTHRKSVADWLANQARLEGYEAGVIHGDVCAARRHEILQYARDLPGHMPYLLCATIDSSATGIDMTFADLALFVELTWEPHELLQAEARLHRFGQANNVLIQYLIARGTGDEIVAQTVVNKLDTYATVVGDVGESLQADLTGAENEIMAEIYAACAQMGEHT